jgi:hypothetical protein
MWVVDKEILVSGTRRPALEGRRINIHVFKGAVHSIECRSRMNNGLIIPPWTV